MEIVRAGGGRAGIARSRVIVIGGGVSTSPFARELARREESLFADDRQELSEVGEWLDEAGDALEREPNMANFRRFRELLGQFAKRATAIAYRIEKTGTLPGGWSEEVVRVVDREADRLFHLVMQEQKDRVGIAGRIANIRGMIVRLSV